MSFSRRTFLATTAAAAGMAALPMGAARAAAKYTRYDVQSPQGKAMLESYAIAIEKMLALPPTDPRNWFRNAFVHFMDCPHGNWWFYVWHRGYVGFFEQTVRELSGNPDFAFPYWDWTELPQIPDAMFDSVLTPVAKAFEPYTRDLDTFTAYMKPALEAYWNTLNPAQRQQLDIRGYTRFDLLWNDVTGFNPSTGKIDPGNQAFAATDRARYLSRDNPKLDDKTAHACSPSVIAAGLLPTQYYDEDVTRSFTSSRTASHNDMPGAGTKFSVLEGQPHNLVHNYIGGVGPWNPGPYGNMTNFLSPVDPIFFLHHSNMDRLWAVWSRKQQSLNLPILPTDPSELASLSDEPFLFFFRADGTPVLDGKAGNYLGMDAFDYDYAPPVGTAPSVPVAAASPAAPVEGAVKSGVGRLQLQAAPTGTLVAVVTLVQPSDPNAPRQFDLLVNAPPGVTQVDVDSPYYGGTVGFFGPPMAGMAHEASFAVPLPQRLPAVRTLMARPGAPTLEIRLAHTDQSTAPVPPLRGISISTL